MLASVEFSEDGAGRFGGGCCDQSDDAVAAPSRCRMQRDGAGWLEASRATNDPFAKSMLVMSNSMSGTG